MPYYSNSKRGRKKRNGAGVVIRNPDADGPSRAEKRKGKVKIYLGRIQWAKGRKEAAAEVGLRTMRGRQQKKKSS